VGDSLGIETLVETVQLLKDREDILFVVGGRGSAMPRLKATCTDSGLENIRFLPFQPREALSLLYASSDLQLVMQRAGMSRVSVPMKAYVIMSSGRPMLVSADVDGEVAALVQEARCGLCVPPEQPEALASAIRSAAEHPEQLRAWGANGRRYAEERLSRRAIAGAYDQLFREIVAGGGA
jgi:colanic acid biosynthesis glycosyl transferase WcaI